ncbi:CbrC family protein [Croceicoccus bisphenolivorans]|uniref:CbrC family protein n=1 Tax=Croceicoccus bisphenolivorans TaxID=1783232 RepID=UPI00082E1AEF|nr:CbrC family protein [Croceicoccus bisphenolivorans]
MTVRRPAFKYFEPCALDAVMTATDAPCECCNASPGELYSGPIFGLRDVELLCLDCIASGRAARELGSSFADVGTAWEVHSDFDREAGDVTAEVLAELGERTPAYSSWQSPVWLFHCGDGGVFHGDASESDVAKASTESRAHFERNFGVPWAEVTDGYTPSGHNGIYRFDCRNCGMVMFHWDCD